MTDLDLSNFETAAEAAAQIVAAFDASVAGLRALGDEFLEEQLHLVGRCESRLAAVKAEKIAALARRDGEARAADVLRNDVKQSKGSARRQVKEAGRLAQVPKTAQALAEGVITPEHARLIAEAAAAAPPGAPVDEQELLTAAGEQPADLFGATVRDHVNERSGDDLEERRKRQRSQRRLSWKKQPDGMFELFGRFDPLTGSRIETAITAAANKLWHAEDSKRRPTAQQRLADALELLVTRRGGDGNKQGTAQGVDLLVIADYDVLAGRLANPRLVDGTPLSAAELLRLACDANIVPAIFDQKSRPLWLGRGRRHVHQSTSFGASPPGTKRAHRLRRLNPTGARPPRARALGTAAANRHRPTCACSGSHCHQHQSTPTARQISWPQSADGRFTFHAGTRAAHLPQPPNGTPQASNPAHPQTQRRPQATISRSHCRCSMGATKKCRAAPRTGTTQRPASTRRTLQAAGKQSRHADNPAPATAPTIRTPARRPAARNSRDRHRLGSLRSAHIAPRPDDPHRNDTDVALPLRC